MPAGEEARHVQEITWERDSVELFHGAASIPLNISGRMKIHTEPWTIVY